jgi:hypothetical protein
MIDFTLDAAIACFRKSDETGALWDAEELAAVQAVYIVAQAYYAACASPGGVTPFSCHGHAFTLVPNSKGEALLFLSPSYAESKPIAWPGFDSLQLRQRRAPPENRLPIDDPRPSLLFRWKHALHFYIGEADVLPMDRLPDPATFPDQFPVDELGIGHLLGEVLGVAALRLFRVSGTSFPGEWSFDPVGQWLHALACVDRTTDTGRLSVVHQIIELGLYAPDRLHVLNKRLDALTNDDLHRMAMEAVQGQSVAPNVFEGLVE